MKGFKDKKGKFHPIGKYSALNKSSISKRNIRKAETIEPTIEEMRRSNPKNSIGLTDRKFIYGGWDKDGISDDKRREGNVVIEQLFNMTNETNPELGITELYEPDIYNTYSTIQNMFRLTANNIDKLIDWRLDGNPKTWKFVTPLKIMTNDSRIYPITDENVFDKMSASYQFLTHAYKQEATLTIMSPDDFLNYADPKDHGASRYDLEYDKKVVDELVEKMENGTPIDSFHLDVNENMEVTDHEGQHRAVASIKAGIKEIPVMIYAKIGTEFSEEQIKEISQNPIETLKTR